MINITKVNQDFLIHANALLCADNGNMLERLRDFEMHAIEHCGAEDSLMRDTAYPSASCHVDEHSAVLASVAEVIELVITQSRFDIARDLAQELALWFPKHTQHMDGSLAQWLVRHASGTAPLIFCRQAPNRGVFPL